MAARRLPPDRRRVVALQLRCAGESFERIAAATGVTPPTAARDVREALVAAQALLSDASGEGSAGKDLLRVLELERLDRLTEHAQRVLDAAQAQGEQLDQLRAIDRLLRIGARRDALTGLAAEAEAPPSPAEDEVDRKRKQREERMLKASGSA